MFPPDRLRRVDARIRRYDAEGESEVVVILAATFLESLLEDMLARIMAAEGASVQLRAAVLDTLRSVGQRLGKLFPTLTGVQFEEAAGQAGLPEFPHRWRALRSERNAFIHDAAFEGAREELGEASAREALALLDQELGRSWSDPDPDTATVCRLDHLEYLLIRQAAVRDDQLVELELRHRVLQVAHGCGRADVRVVENAAARPECCPQVSDRHGH